jgi:type VI secretion system protein ImpK
MPLLQVLARLRTTAHQPNPADLYERTARALHGFEQRAREAGVAPEQIRSAHYALCVSLDDVVLNTPWGAASEWAKRPLTAAFHQDPSQGGRFFELLARLRQDTAKFLPVIEIMYLCLSLGFMGRYRASPQGAAELDRIRAETCALIAAQTTLGPELSGRWRGISAPYKRLHGGAPVWVGYAAALAACGGLFLWIATSLNASSDTQYARMLSAPPARMPVITRAAFAPPLPPPPPPSEPTVLDRLQTALKADTATGIVTITGTPATPIIRVSNRLGFATASATMQPVLSGIFERIGTALRDLPGTIEVIGYTDNQPIRTVQFPSNFHLSAARAKAAAAVLARAIGDPGRVRAEGRADADPIASNATAEGREQNRRIEIVLHSQD